MRRTILKNYIIAALLLWIIIQGCGLFGEDEVTAGTEAVQPGKQIDGISPDTIQAGSRDTMVLLKDGEALVRGHIEAGKTKPVYTLPAWQGQQVVAVLKAVPKGGNVRINQVQLPSGDFDGPFGDTLRLALKNSGKLKIIIGENQMAGKPYSGDFLLHIKVK